MGLASKPPQEPAQLTALDIAQEEPEIVQMKQKAESFNKMVCKKGELKRMGFTRKKYKPSLYKDVIYYGQNIRLKSRCTIATC